MRSVWLISLEVLFIVGTLVPNLSEGLVQAQDIYLPNSAGRQPAARPSPPPPPAAEAAAASSSSAGRRRGGVDVHVGDADDVDADDDDRGGNVHTYKDNRNIVAFFQGEESLQEPEIRRMLSIP
ncbi:Hypothetical predicted protein [Octopus vulgaris]|uniref:Uncharacterized protein n=1 Tax=Octopus vulgaris TaxID=6645 RepID=A0AA36B641_OCTVU|nr:Hypothetical predicted protein [Octopus vulgaris]